MAITIPADITLYGLLVDRPATAVDGVTWQVTDTGDERLTIYRGGAWHDCLVSPAYAPGLGGGGPGTSFPYVTPPLSSAFTWDNQGAATKGDGFYGPWMYLNTTGLQGRFNFITHTAPKDLTAVVKVTAGVTSSNAFRGIAIRSGGAGGKYMGFGLYGAASGYQSLIVSYYSAPATYAGAPSGPTSMADITASDDIWLRIHDDGTTIYFQWSGDEGAHWQTYYSELRTAHIGTPDAYALYLDANTAGLPCALYLKSWHVA